MKNVITSTLLITSLITVLPLTQVLAESGTESQVSQENAEQSWQEALKTQVALASTKLALLQARTEHWINQNKEATLRSLDEASANLDEAWHSADLVTRARITALKQEIDQASALLQEKGQEAKLELREIANRSESTLNAALAQSQIRSATLKAKTVTRYDLVQAKAEALNARIALEIDNSPENAKQALQNAEGYLRQAKVSTSTATVEQVALLQEKALAAQQAVSDGANDAKSRVNELVISTEEQIQAYEKTIRESEEAKLLKKRYVQLEAKAALLKANLATRADTTGSQAAIYLDESRAWYDSLKSQMSQRSNQELSDMSAHIEEAKQAVQRKDKQARVKLAELLERAAAMLKETESTQ